MHNFSIGGTPIEIATKYKYLGTLFSTINQSEETKIYIVNSCSRALYKIIKYCNKLGQLPPSTALNLYNSLIAPPHGLCLRNLVPQDNS